MRTKITIDEALFAHINNDPFLVGSYHLQGNRTKVTVHFLNSYLEQDQTAATNPEIKRLQKALNEMVYWIERIESIELDFKSEESLKSAYNKIATDFIDTLMKKAPHEMLLLPGGWHALKEGHAMVYQFEKDREGNILYHIHNSGAGLHFHEKQSKCDKEYYNPVLTYKIPAQSIQEKRAFLDEILSQIISLNNYAFHKKPTYSAKNLYQDNLYQLAHLDATILPSSPDTLDHWLTGGQLSGTCTQKSLHQMLKSCFSTQDGYRKFIYGFKIYSLECYFATLQQQGLSESYQKKLNSAGYSDEEIAQKIKEGLFTDPQHLPQLEKAIRHNLRLLNNKSTENPKQALFDQKQIAEDLQRLNEWLKQINRAKVLSKNTKPIQENNSRIEVEGINFQKIPEIRYTDATSSTLNKANKTNSFPEPLVLAGGSTLFQELDALITRSDSLKSEQKQYALLEQLDLFFNQLPLPNQFETPLLAFYQSIDSEQKAMEFYLKLTSLQNLYFECCAQLISQKKATPAMYLSKMTVLSVLGHINYQFPILKDGTYFHKLLTTHLLHALAPGSRDTVQLATQSPYLDERLKRIKKLYSSSANRVPIALDEKIYQYYDQVLSTYPTLKNNLTESYYAEYGTNQSSTHLKIRHLRIEALYYFFEKRMKKASFNEEFSPLLETFKLQEALENALVTQIGSLGVNINSKLEYDFYFDDSPIYSGDSIETISPFFKKGRDPFYLNLTSELQESKFKTDSALFKAVFKRDIDESMALKMKRSDNHTQLVPATQAETPPKENSASTTVNAGSLVERELFHLRRHPGTQIALTMDYFKQHLHYLKENDYQIYVEANLFQPGLLLDLLQQPLAHEHLKQIDGFIQKGLQFYQKKAQLNQNCLFFLRIQFLVNQYAFDYDATIYEERQFEFHKLINTYLPFTQDIFVRQTLHELRFLCLTKVMQKINLSNQFNQERFESYVVSQVHSNPYQTQDIDSKLKCTLEKYKFQRLIAQTEHFKHLDETELRQLFKELALKLPQPMTVSNQYPLYSIYDENEQLVYSVDVEQGLVFNKEGWAYVSLPLDILTHPALPLLGLNKVNSGFLIQNSGVYLIEQALIKARFIKNPSGGYDIQKIFTNSEGTEDYFQLMAQTSLHQQHYQLTTLLKSDDLSSLLTQRDLFFWKNSNREELRVTTIEQREGYLRGIKSYDGSYVFASVSSGAQYLHHTSDLPQALSQFEAKRFVSVFKSESQRTIEFARYNLTFIENKLTQVIQCTLQGQDFNLKTNQAPPEGLPGLVLERNQQTHCIISIQRFINTGERQEQSEYYQLDLDQQHIIAQLEMKNHACPLWQYNDSESYYVFALNKEEEPIPRTTEQALYLAYLYLGLNQAEKAWQILQEVNQNLGGLEGTQQELRYLRWIFTALPYERDEDPESAIISTPQFEACKLKALSLYTRFKQQGKKVDYKEKEYSASINDCYARQQSEQDQSFENNINKLIDTHYSCYQKMLRDKPIELTLSHEDKKSLLDYYHSSQKASAPGRPVALGALGAEWVALRLGELKKELRSLELKQKLNHYESNRILELKRFIKEHQGVAKRYSQLELVPINTYFDPWTQVNVSLYNNELRDFWKDWRNPLKQVELSQAAQQSRAMKTLRLGVSENAFMSEFIHYLAIANNPKSPLRPELLQFCTRELISKRHKKINASAENIPLLCNILARMINSNQSLAFRTEKNLFGLKRLEQLVKAAAALPDFNLSVYQLVDHTDKILQTAEEIIEALPAFEPVRSVAIKITKAAQPETLWVELVQQQAIKWRALESSFLSNEDKDIPLVSFLTETEQLHGLSQYQALNKLQLLIREPFNEGALITLDDEINGTLSKESIALEALEQQILTLSQKNFSIDFRAELASGQREPLTLHKLLNLFYQNNLDLYLQETLLTEQEVSSLHQDLALYVATKTQIQHLNRVQKAIKQIDPTAEDNSASYFELGKTLYAENLINPLQEPALAVYQIYEDVLIRPIQYDVIKRLLAQKNEGEISEHIERIIMGGGKSKVLLPTMAYSKANGTRLVIIAVPPSLLKTNFVDLRATSFRLFNQEAHLFEFNRDSDSSSERLKELFQQLTEIMLNKHYLVTTKEALQSLELKYLELLFSPPDAEEEHIAEWNEQVHYAEKLLHLFKERGDLLIDEVHEGLWLKNKLNYSLGDPQNISRRTIKDTLSLYHFLSTIPLEQDKKVFLIDVLKAPDFLPKDLREPMFQKMAYELVHQQKSPLNSICSKLNHQEKEALVAYLLNKGPQIPSFVIAMEASARDKIALFKEELNNLLPHTLFRHHKEHYGPSHKTNIPAERRVQAIPYSANNTPNERSRYAKYLQTINYTIQSLLIDGAPLDLFKSYMQLLKTQAEQESIEQKENNLNNTPSGALFRALVKRDEYSLDELDVENDQLMQELHQHCAHSEELLYELLEKSILPAIQSDPRILHSDVFNFVDMVRSCQGMTGTPWNHSTYHSRLEYDPKTAQGVDGLVYQALKNKTDGIIGFDFQSTNHAITTLFDRYEEETPLRAIIDISAAFKGVANLDVAHEIARYLSAPEHRNTFQTQHTLKHILYFNQDNEITALPLEGYPYTSPIIIGNSDPNLINERLNSTPEERFTFYDQAHTTGTDIKQSNKAKALVMIDEHTMLSKCFQGIMRLRALIEGQQRLDLIVPTRLKDHSLDQLCELMNHQERDSLKDDHFAAALAQMSNVIRNEVLNTMLLIQGENAYLDKRELLLAFEAFFVESQDLSLFEQYGALSVEEPTRLILERRKKNMLSNYARILEELGRPIQAEALALLEQDSMNPIIEKICQPGMCHELQILKQADLDKQVEIQKEIEVEVETEKEMQREFYDPHVKEAKYCSWLEFGSQPACLTLNEICLSSGVQKAFEFSDAIAASVNFYRNTEEQTNFINMFLKPVHTLMFTKKGEQLSCILLTQSEAEEFIDNKILQMTYPDHWFSTTQHTLLYGTPPESFREDPEYQKIIEQVRFFNGEFSLLLSGDIKLNWLLEQPKDKIRFFEQHLLRNHETAPKDFAILQKKLISNNRLYQFIIKHPKLDGEHYDWRSAYPELDDYELNEANSLSTLCNTLVNTWETLDLQSTAWRSGSMLSPMALGYLQRIVEEVKNLQYLLSCVQKPIDNKPPKFQEALKALKLPCPDSALELAITLYDLIERKELQQSQTLLNLFKESLAQTDPLPEAILLKLCQTARNEPELTLDLLKQPKLNEQHLEVLSYHKLNGPMIMTLCTHPRLPASAFLRIFHQAQILGHSMPTKVAELLLPDRPSCPQELIQAISTDQSIKFEPTYLMTYLTYVSQYDDLLAKSKDISSLLADKTFVNELLTHPNKLKATQIYNLISLMKHFDNEELTKFILTFDEVHWNVVITSNLDLAIRRRSLQSLLESTKDKFTNRELTSLLPLLQNVAAEVNLSKAEHEFLLEVAESNQSIVDALIANSSSLITATSLNKIIDFKGLTEQQLVLLCQRPLLPDTVYVKAYRKAKTFNTGSQIAGILLQRNELFPAEFIKELGEDLTALSFDDLMIYTQQVNDYNFLPNKLGYLNQGEFIPLQADKTGNTNQEHVLKLLDFYPEQNASKTILLNCILNSTALTEQQLYLLCNTQSLPMEFYSIAYKRAKNLNISSKIAGVILHKGTQFPQAFLAELGEDDTALSFDDLKRYTQQVPDYDFLPQKLGYSGPEQAPPLHEEQLTHTKLDKLLALLPFYPESDESRTKIITQLQKIIASEEKQCIEQLAGNKTIPKALHWSLFKRAEQLTIQKNVTAQLVKHPSLSSDFFELLLSEASLLEQFESQDIHYIIQHISTLKNESYARLKKEVFWDIIANSKLSQNLRVSVLKIYDTTLSKAQVIQIIPLLKELAKEAGSSDSALKIIGNAAEIEEQLIESLNLAALIKLTQESTSPKLLRSIAIRSASLDYSQELLDAIINNKYSSEPLGELLHRKEPINFAPKALIKILTHNQNRFSLDLMLELLNRLTTSIKLNSSNKETITHKQEYRYSLMTQAKKEKLIKTGLFELNLLLSNDELDKNKLKQKFSQLCKIACTRRGKIGAFFSPRSVHTHAAQSLLNKFKDNHILLDALNINTHGDVKAQLTKKMQQALDEPCEPQVQSNQM